MTNWTPEELYLARDSGLLLLDEGKYRQSETIFAGLVSIDSRDTYSWIGLGLSLQGLGELEPASEAFETALRVEPESWRAALALTEIRLLQGSHRHAAAIAPSAVQLSSSPTCPATARSRIRTLARLAEGTR